VCGIRRDVEDVDSTVVEASAPEVAPVVGEAAVVRLVPTATDALLTTLP
jgi:hypothetical protein